MTRVAVSRTLLAWALDRAGQARADYVQRKFKKLDEWLEGTAQPTIRQLEDFAKSTYTPFGYFFLPEPPPEPVPIPDFRTMRDTRVRRPSPDLLDIVYLCQHRQDWYRDFARAEGEEPLPFVGAASVQDDVVRTAAAIREALDFDIEARRRMPTWTDALRRFIEQADAIGVLVMVSGVVGSNNRRKLDPQEFRGFALADPLAPLVFVNGADSKAAQMFTLAHELAHIWLGQTALSDSVAVEAPAQAVERWCSQVAAELLVPIETFRTDHNPRAELRGELDRLARRFKVSTLVVLRRIHDAGTLRGDAYWRAYEEELQRLAELPKGSGGDFYLTLGARVSKRFARALIVSTLEGRTLYRDAFRMLGIKRDATFHELGAQLGYSA